MYPLWKVDIDWKSFPPKLTIYPSSETVFPNPNPKSCSNIFAPEMFFWTRCISNPRQFDWTSCKLLNEDVVDTSVIDLDILLTKSNIKSLGKIKITIVNPNIARAIALINLLVIFLWSITSVINIITIVPKAVLENCNTNAAKTIIVAIILFLFFKKTLLVNKITNVNKTINCSFPTLFLISITEVLNNTLGFFATSNRKIKLTTIPARQNVL